MTPLPTLAAPGAIERRRQLADTILMSGLQSGPVGHWTQGASRMAHALVGALGTRRADREEAEGKKAGQEGTQALLQALLNKGVQPSIQPGAGSPAGGSMAAAGNMEPTQAPGADRQALLDAFMKAQGNEWVDPGVTKFAMERLIPDPKDPIKMGKGDTLLDPETYQPLYTPSPEELAANDEYGLNPVYGKDAQGNTVILQLGKSGNVKQPELPEDFDLTPGVDKVDLGTHWGILNRAGDVVSTIEKDIAGAAAQEKIGESQGAAEASIPKVKQAADTMLGIISSIRYDPMRESTTGWQSNVPIVGGDPRSGFQGKVKQLRGQIFLQAFETLKGAGAITEREGAAATDAATRVETGLGDKEFLKALGELEAIVRIGVQRMEERAGGAPAPAPAPVVPPAAPQMAPVGAPMAPPQVSPQAAPPANDIFDDEATIPEGATVEDEQGRRFKKQNGQLVPVQ